MRRARAMDDSPGNDKSLSWIEFYRLVFEVNEQLAIDDVEELIVGIMLVPVILTLENAKPNDGIIYLAQRLVIPLELASIGESFGIDNFKGFVENIQAGFVSVLVRFGHGAPQVRTNSSTLS
jgi:hypothetical protein